jgi:drug/metabolite transporter (DMT)-like permease
VLGLIGVVIIVRPFGAEISTGQLIALAASFGFASSVIFVKSLIRTDKVVTILFWMLAIQSVIGLVPALQDWRSPSLHVWTWILVIAFCGAYSHYCMTRALQHAEATIVVPMDFLRVPLAGAIGWLIYNEGIDIYLAVGAGLILAGNLLNLKGAGQPASKTPR